MPVAPWDLVVVDEAHDACGDSDRHEICDELARRSRHVLLLTATPHSGDHVRFSRLERLGELDGTLDPLTIFRRTRAALSANVTRHVRWRRIALSTAESRTLDALAAFERTMLGATTDGRRDAAMLLLSVFRKRALSTMASLHVSLERRLAWVEGQDPEDSFDWLQPRLAFDGAGVANNLDDDDWSGLTVDSGVPRKLERTWLRRLRVLTQTALRSDTKVARLAAAVAKSREAVVIFTEFRHSLAPIERALSRYRQVAVLHGGQSLLERRLSLDRFLSGRADALVATDVASQGLNLQSRARWVVSFEIPWNPARLEQRVGRVDRIGQTRPVHATFLIARHPAEAGLLYRLAVRTVTARRSLGEEVLPDLGPMPEQLAAILLTGSAPAPPALRPVLRSDARWARPARALARVLMKRRSIGRLWRVPHETTPQPSWSTLRLKHLGALGAGTLIVCSIPLIDGAGRVVESRLLCLTSKEMTPESARALLGSAAFRRLLETRVGARLARIRRLVTSPLERQARTERAIADHLREIGCPEEVQPSLFDRTTGVAFDARREHSVELTREADVRLRLLLQRAEIELGEPVVELILWARR
jgi:hypothetical protein